jgi:uncharacterized UBP type Zn finger protein
MISIILPFHSQHDAQEALLQMLTFLSQESQALLENVADDATDENLKSLCLSTRFNTECVYYQSCDVDMSTRGCGDITAKYVDEYGMLGLDINSPVSRFTHSYSDLPTLLHEYLSKYCTGDHVPERLCSKCGKTDTTLQFCVVSTAPSELILHIQRNIYDKETGALSKDNRRVTFPPVLHFSNCGNFPQGFFPFHDDIDAVSGEETYHIYPNCASGVFALSPSVQNVHEFFTKKEVFKSVPKSKLQYELTSVIRHTGKTIYEGHYVIDVCSRSADNVKCWTRYDDDKERPTSEVYRYYNKDFSLFFFPS